jgi:hypothetical protein
MQSPCPELVTDWGHTAKQNLKKVRTQPCTAPPFQELHLGNKKNKKKGAEQSILLYHVSGSKKATTILTGFMIEIHDKTHCPVHGSITRSNHNSIIYSWTTVYLFFDYHYFHRKDPKSKWLVDQQSGKD